MIRQICKINFSFYLVFLIFIEMGYAIVEEKQKIGYYNQFELPYGYEADRIFKPPVISPFDIVVTAKEDILFTGLENDLIYKVSSEGNVTNFANAGRTTLAFNSNGELFCDSFDRILKISPDGKTEIFVSGMGAFQMAVSPTDDLFIIESHSSIINKVDPSGKKTVFVSGLSNPCDLEFSPSGELYVTEMGTGEISRINSDRSVTTVAKGFSINDPIFIAFDPSGNLFALDMMNFGLAEVSLKDGIVKPLPFFAPLMPLGAFGDFIFDKNGDIFLLGTSRNYVFKLSVKEEKINVLVPGYGNSSALAVAPSGEIFMGNDNSFPFLPGKIIKIGKDGNVSTFADGFGFVNDITLDFNGNLYVFSFIPESNNKVSGGAIIKISADGVATKIFDTHHELSSIAINPITRDIVGFDINTDRIIKITPAQEAAILPIYFKGDVHKAHIAFDEKGNMFIFVIFKENFGKGPLKRRLFKITPHNKVTLLANLDTSSSSSTDDLSIAVSGDIFVIASEPPVFKILKITPKGKITVFAKNLPCDPLSLTTDKQGNIFFASSAGVFKIFKSRTKLKSALR